MMVIGWVGRLFLHRLPQSSNNKARSYAEHLILPRGDWAINALFLGSIGWKKAAPKSSEQGFNLGNAILPNNNFLDHVENCSSIYDLNR